MNFKTHAAGGLITASIITSFCAFSLNSILDIANPLLLFGVCFFMSLFPDFDTASIPQRWFYRALTVVLIVLYLYQEYETISLLSIFSLTPLLHKHRGWTHWKITPFIISIIMLFLYDRTSNLSVYSLDIISINYAFFVLAVVGGHYTHLLLDSKYFKNEKGHH